MITQEKDLLTRFLQQMIATQAGQKDAEADALIRDAVARQPDAAYLLVQRAMQLDQLLESAQARIQKLQAEVEQARAGSAPASTGFLSDATWGSKPGVAAQNVAAQRPASAQTSVAGGPLGAAPLPAAPAAQAAPARASAWGGGSMLGNVATTAAGVVAGSFLFQGIQGLMHHGDNASTANHQLDHPQVADADSPRLLNDTPPNDDLNNLADIDDTSDYASSDDGGGDYA